MSYERFGYKMAPLAIKLRLLKNLLESQFDANLKFKQEINNKSAPELRMKPLGTDKLGNAYWYHFDPKEAEVSLNTTLEFECVREFR